MAGPVDDDGDSPAPDPLTGGGVDPSWAAPVGGSAPPPPPPPAWSGPSAVPAPPVDPFAGAAGAPVAGPRRVWPWVVGGVALAVVLGGGAVAAGLLVSRAGGLLGTGPRGGGAAGAGDVYVTDLAVGDCYVLDEADRKENVASWVSLVPCTAPHDGEVYAVVPLGFDEWPGERALSDAAERECGDAEQGLDEAVYDEPGLGPTYYLPDESTWGDEPKTAQCVVESTSPLGLTRSWRWTESASASPSS